MHNRGKMNNIHKTNETVPFSIEKYSKCRNCVPVTQAALGVIIALGLTMSLLSHFGYVDHTFIYVGAGASVAALITLGILTVCQPNNLKSAVNNAKSFSDIKEIVDTMEVYRPCCSWGNWLGATDDLEINSTQLKGSISSYALDHKFNELINSKNNFSRQELVLVKEIDNIFNSKCEAIDEYERLSIPDKYLKRDYLNDDIP